ncbi:MAG TPA: glycosyltransferase family 4 protein [Thermoanaerobaculia bacterium]|jgi:glycosyltransferase involved in cell wall biosynthesis|nr:glycosyltransferase family 4 protein [Thermoanaerobaculia bacterium]
MKIAYLLPSTDLSSSVKVALAQAEALARRGHRVTVVSPDEKPAWFPLLQARFERSEFGDAEELAAADVRVATLWETVRAALADARGPVFHLCQGYEGELGVSRDLWPEIEAVYRLPTRKLAVSKPLARRLEDLGFGPVIDVGQAFDASEFPPGPLRPPADPPIVLVVGPFEAPTRGIPIALDGLALWRDRGGRFRLRRVSTLAPTEEERGRGLTAEYHRGLAPGRMPFAYRSADVVIGASRPEEGFDLPALEALSCGVPALLSDTPGHRDVAGDTAWYFRQGDPESLAAGLPALLSPPARARARSAGPAAASRCDTASVAERLEGAFRGALGGAA